MNEIFLIIICFCIPVVIYFIIDHINFQKEMEYTSKNTYLEMEVSKLKRSLEFEKKEKEYLIEENKKLIKKINELQEDLLREIKWKIDICGTPKQKEF